MLCKTAKGRLIKIRVDLASERPHAMTNYQLQGTDGAYESSRAHGEAGKIWLRRERPSASEWLDFDSLMRVDAPASSVMPERWQHPPEAALQAGHGGGDYFVLEDFLRSCRREIPCPIGIHEAMDMTLPGLCSQRSVLEGGAWIEVPDSRMWSAADAPRPQLQMLLNTAALEHPPEPVLAAGYVLRQFRDLDAESYLTMLRRSGLADFSSDRFEQLRRTRLPGGFFVVEHCASGAIAASAMASHAATEQHPNAGAVDWVASDPDHRGKQLGAVVTAAAIRRLKAAGYERIYLLTDDHRLPAIRVYLRLGFEPLMFAPGIEARWDAIFGQLAGSKRH
jgi:mycothiol synthase